MNVNQFCACGQSNEKTKTSEDLEKHAFVHFTDDTHWPNWTSCYVQYSKFIKLSILKSGIQKYELT